MATFSFLGSELEQLSFEQAIREEGFLLVQPDVRYRATGSEEELTVEAGPSFWNEALWRDYQDGDENEPRFYYFDLFLSEQEMRAEIDTGKQSMSVEQVRAIVDGLAADGFRLAAPRLARAIPEVAPASAGSERRLTRRVLYSLYDFDGYPHREAMIEMNKYAAQGFLDPHSAFLLSIPEVYNMYLSGRFWKTYEKLTYTDNVLLNTLEGPDLISYGAVVPNELFNNVLEEVLEEYKHYFLKGNRAPRIDELLQKDLRELVTNYTDYALWWENSVFVAELERKHGLPVTGDATSFLDQQVSRTESDLEIVNTLSGEGVAFSPERFDFAVEDVDYRRAVSPLSLRIALEILATDERMNNEVRLGCFAQLLEAGGSYYRYAKINEAIPGYVREDTASDSPAWHHYLTTAFRFGDARVISTAAAEYRFFTASFPEEELLEIFMRRGVTLYYQVANNFEEMFGRRVEEIPNAVLARALPYLDDVMSFNTYFRKKEYDFLLEPEYAQQLLQSAAAVSQLTLSYFLEKLDGVAINKGELYEHILGSGNLKALFAVTERYGPAHIKLDYTKLTNLNAIAYLLDNGFQLDKTALVEYLCRAYRGVFSLDILRTINADFEEIARISLALGNPLLAIGAALNLKST